MDGELFLLQLCSFKKKASEEDSRCPTIQQLVVNPTIYKGIADHDAHSRKKLQEKSFWLRYSPPSLAPLVKRLQWVQTSAEIFTNKDTLNRQPGGSEKVGLIHVFCDQLSNLIFLLLHRLHLSLQVHVSRGSARDNLPGYS